MANQNVTQLTQQTVSANTTSLFYAVTGGTTDTGLPLSVFVNSLGLTGTPTAPTATTGTNTTQIASTAFVQAQLTSTLASYAVLNGPTFTGNVTLNTGGSNPLFTIISGPQTIDLVNNSSNGTYGWFNATTGHQAEIFNATTDQATFFTRPLFGSATPWDNANLNFAAPPAIGGTTPAAGAFTTLSAAGNFTPSQTNGIVGTTTNNNANAGSVGEYITATGTAVSLTTATAANVTSISLTAGDWDVWGNIVFNPAASTTTTLCEASISTTTATHAASPLYGLQSNSANFGAANAPAVAAPMQRINVSTTTTVFLVATAIFAVSTETATGIIQARRRR